MKFHDASGLEMKASFTHTKRIKRRMWILGELWETVKENETMP
jgi:hypothetical protein